MTQAEAAKTGRITSEMKQVAEKEGLDPEFIRLGDRTGYYRDSGQYQS